MQMEAQAAPTNLPKYPAVSINEKSPYHVFVYEGDLTKAFKALYDSVPDGVRKSLLTVGGDSALDEYITRLNTETLSSLLAALMPNTTLYLQGSEAFIWDINSLAIEQGMVAEQIKMLAPVTRQRRVFCTHCYTIMEGVTHTPVVCSGCQRNLLVRDHFSRLHSAYVGLQIDAEDPADLPDIEELS